LEPQQIYLEMYKEWRTHLRHHETQRSTITTVCFGFAAATLAYVYAHPGDARQVRAAGFFLVALGIVALILSLKQYDRMQRTLEMAMIYQQAVDGLTVHQLAKLFAEAKKSDGDRFWRLCWRWLTGWAGRFFRPRTKLSSVASIVGDATKPSVLSLYSLADVRHEDKHPVMFRVELHFVWAVLFSLIIGIGIHVIVQSYHSSPQLLPSPNASASAPIDQPSPPTHPSGAPQPLVPHHGTP
jgi:hypothetical protein